MEAKGWIEKYSGNFPFYLSLQKQFRERGTLSDKQWDCVERALQKEATPRPTTPPKAPTYADGSFIEIKRWYANVKKEELGLPIFFRNLKVVSTQAESAKAVQVTVEFRTSIATRCHVCGLQLDNEISLATGIGPVCAKRLGVKRPTLANAHEIVEAIEKEAQIAGQIGPLWIPKSQIVGRAS